jgi:hypothetical protein
VRGELLMNILIFSNSKDAAMRKLQQIRKEIQSTFYLGDSQFFKIDNELKLLTYDNVSYQAVITPLNLMCGKRADMILVDEDMVCEEVMWCVEPLVSCSKLPREVRIVYFKDNEDL